MSTKEIKAERKQIKIDKIIIITITLVGLILLGIWLLAPIIILASYLLVIMLGIIQIVYPKIKKAKITENNKKSLIMCALCVILAPVLIYATSITSYTYSARRSLPSDILDTIITLKPAIKTMKLGDAKISIYSIDYNYSIPSEYGELEPNKKAVSIEFHAESTTGGNINQSCYFSITSKIETTEDLDYNNDYYDKSYKSTNSILPQALSIPKRDMGCPTDMPNDYIISIVAIVDSNATKIKLKYYGDKVYYIDLN